MVLVSRFLAKVNRRSRSMLTDRGAEYCGRVAQHDYQLYLAINDIDHTETKAMSPQTNGICDTLPQDHIE